MKKMVIAGGTGFLGQLLTAYFNGLGVEVVILTRRHQLDHDLTRYVKWDGRSLGFWQKELEDADVLINLNGKSVDCRYTHANKQEIYDTRLEATHVLGKAFLNCENPPKVWINASSATIYRHAEDQEMDERSGEIGEGFSVDVCKKWERVFDDVKLAETRKIALRMAIVLGKNGGALQPLKQLARFGLGGKQGNGRQYFSWVHERDFVRAVHWIIQNERASGVYNLSAPDPVPNSEMMRELRSVLNKPFGLPSPKWLLEIGARLIGTETELVLKSRRVVPVRLMEEGFKFEYTNLSKALQSLIGSEGLLKSQEMYH